MSMHFCNSFLSLSLIASSALVSGIANENTEVYCGGIYTYYSDYQPGCIMGFVGDVSVRTALRYSCNIYFYDMARQMGIDYLAKVAGWFGVGQDLNLEIGGATGNMSSPNTLNRSAEHGRPARLYRQV